MQFPSVQLLLKQYRLNSQSIKATGPKQSLLKGDVLQYIAANNIKPVKFELAASTTFANIIKWGKIKGSTIKSIEAKIKGKISVKYTPVLFADAPLTPTTKNSFDTLTRNTIIRYDYPQKYQTKLTVDAKHLKELQSLLS